MYDKNPLHNCLKTPHNQTMHLRIYKCNAISELKAMTVKTRQIVKTRQFVKTRQIHTPIVPIFKICNTTHTTYSYGYSVEWEA